jgi:hypothetical protein
MNIHKKKIIDCYGHEPTTLDELAYCVIANLNRFDGRNKEKCKVVGFSWDITRREVSNSHSAPLNGVENFMGDKNRPTSYPGWSGRVWVRYQSKITMFGSHPFRNTATHTGTGGFGSYSGPWEAISRQFYENKINNIAVTGVKIPEPQVYSWDYKIFAADWPLVDQNFIDTYSKHHAWAVLNNQRVDQSITKHRFLWEDPETKAADQAYMEFVGS